MADLKYWPRVKGWIAPTSGPSLADLYVCRDAKNLYLSVLPMEFLDEKLYVDDKIPERERSEWVITLDGHRIIRIRSGGKNQRATVSASDVEVGEGDGLMHRLTVKVPLRASSPRLERGTARPHSSGSQPRGFGTRSRMALGTPRSFAPLRMTRDAPTLRLSVTFATHSRGYVSAWKTDLKVQP